MRQVWTDNGCRGVFDLNNATVTCDVNGTGQHVCAGASTGNVTCFGWISDLQKEILLNQEVGRGEAGWGALQRRRPDPHSPSSPRVSWGRYSR